MAKKWIKSAIKNKGALTRQAKAKGMTVAQFCSSPGRKSTTTKRR